MHKSVPEKFTIRDVIAAAYINVYVRHMELHRTTHFSNISYRVTAHDVVAITLRAVVYYLAKNPAMKKKLQQEIDDAETAGKLSNPAKYTEIIPLSYV